MNRRLEACVVVALSEMCCVKCDVWKVHATRTAPPRRKREKLTAAPLPSASPPPSFPPSFAAGAVGKFKLYLTGGNTLARSLPLRRLILPLNDMIFHAMHPSSCTEPEFITALHTYLGRHRPCLAIFLPPGARSLKSFCFLA